MVGRYHQINGHEFGPIPRDSEKDREAWLLQSTGSQRVRHNYMTEQPPCRAARLNR